MWASCPKKKPPLTMCRWQSLTFKPGVAGEGKMMTMFSILKKHMTQQGHVFLDGEIQNALNLSKERGVLGAHAKIKFVLDILMGDDPSAIAEILKSLAIR